MFFGFNEKAVNLAEVVSLASAPMRKNGALEYTIRFKDGTIETLTTAHSIEQSLGVVSVAAPLGYYAIALLKDQNDKLIRDYSKTPVIAFSRSMDGETWIAETLHGYRTDSLLHPDGSIVTIYGDNFHSISDWMDSHFEGDAS
jgi:hypothetical protein